MKVVLLPLLLLAILTCGAQEHRCFCFQLKNGKQSLPFKLVFTSDTTGLVQYKGQTGKIGVKLATEKLAENDASGRGALVTTITWHEADGTKVSGVYIFETQGANMYLKSYTRMKDGRKFLPFNDTGKSCEQCF